MFGSKARFYAGCHAEAGQPTYYYMFTRTPPSPKQTVGAFHAAELPFVHGTNTPVLPLTEADLALSKQMIGYWTQFAKTADPNLPSQPQWEPFNDNTSEWMLLGNDFVGMKPVDREEKYQILNSHTKRLVAAMQMLQFLA